MNKYGDNFKELLSKDLKFHYIIDNNLFSFACCINHAKSYISNLIKSLEPWGKIVTHVKGMKWVTNSCALPPLNVKSLRDFVKDFNLEVIKKRNGVVILKLFKCE